jgi:hypothetical protein
VAARPIAREAPVPVTATTCPTGSGSPARTGRPAAVTVPKTVSTRAMATGGRAEKCARAATSTTAAAASARPAAHSGRHRRTGSRGAGALDSSRVIASSIRRMVMKSGAGGSAWRRPGKARRQAATRSLQAAQPWRWS